MGDAPGMRLVDLHAAIRERLYAKVTGMEGGCDEVVSTTLRFWPERTMTAFAKDQASARGLEVLDAISVIWAKVREDLEARWGMDKNTAMALDILVHPVVVEVANVWFSSPDARASMRGCIVEANRLRSP